MWSSRLRPLLRDFYIEMKSTRSGQKIIYISTRESERASLLILAIGCISLGIRKLMQPGMSLYTLVYSARICMRRIILWKCPSGSFSTHWHFAYYAAEIVIGAALLQIVYLFYKSSARANERFLHRSSIVTCPAAIVATTYSHFQHTHASRIWCYALLTFLNNKDLLSVRSLTPSDTHTSRRVYSVRSSIL